MITSGYGYDENEVILSGLSRFDNLIKEKKNKYKLKMIKSVNHAYMETSLRCYE